MEYEFYYADSNLTVVIKADAEDVFAQLTDNEYLSLQQIIYIAVKAFLITRALFLTDNAEPKEKPESEKDTVDLPADER